MSIIYISPSVEIVEPILSARQDPVEQYYLSFEPHTEKKKTLQKPSLFKKRESLKSQQVLTYTSRPNPHTQTHHFVSKVKASNTHITFCKNKIVNKHFISDHSLTESITHNKVVDF